MRGTKSSANRFGSVGTRKMYDPEVIESYPASVEKQAEVNVTSKKGTTGRDRELKKGKIQHAEERETRSKKTFSIF